MDELELEAFLGVVRANNLSKAAENLFVAQSTISHRLKSLETRLGVHLIDRKPGRSTVTLTPEGLELLEVAERWENVRLQISQLGHRSEVSLRVGASDSVNTYFLDSVYALMRTRRPDLRLRIHTSNSPEMYHLLGLHEVDVAFVQYYQDLPNTECEEILREPLVVVSKAKLKTRNGAVLLESLDPLAELYADWGPEYERWHAKQFPKLPARIHVDTARLIVPFLSDLRAWTLAPLSMARSLQHTHGCPLYRPEPAPPDRIIHKVFMTALSQASQRGHELLRQCLEERLRQLRNPG